ncbi:MAG: hypothetical protein UT63_C0044G0011 [Candidatus Gottesmanbacteria bacterium GW2011_GWC2_39_8]|uniref:Uncharacterized protein n=1 Tax=Candidatus Gottesmanbacteria bacterium GW2011_GWC2_39_8 TaxID=1618450 RepID=A0A0G0PWA1_9BACT|nr:MAG: hypothetical protein UT63_C0044G0011 [Candidatus Gottesmanbacteria bacterium GW2011_GWC2_39_8]
MKNVLSVLPILSAAQLVTGLPKDSDTTHPERDVIVVVSAVNHLSAFLHL